MQTSDKESKRQNFITANNMYILSGASLSIAMLIMTGFAGFLITISIFSGIAAFIMYLD